jgi:hypothetical protein
MRARKMISNNFGSNSKISNSYKSCYAFTPQTTILALKTGRNNVTVVVTDTLEKERL